MRRRFAVPRLSAWLLPAGLMAQMAGCRPDAANPPLDAGPVRAAATDTLLFGIRDLAVAPNGDIWVLSRHDPYIRRFSLDGRLTAAFGRDGDGPGEFRAPRAFVRGERLSPPRVLDPGHRLIVQLDSTGREVGRWSFHTAWGFVRSDFEDVSYGQLFRASAASDSDLVSLVYLGDVGTTRDLRRSALVRFSAAGVARDTLISFHQQFGSQQDGAVPRWLVTVPLVAGCPDGTTAAYDGMANEIRGYGGGPGALWRVALPPGMTRPRAMPVQDLERYLRYRVLGELLENRIDTTTLGRRVDEVLRSSRGWYASTVPVAVGLLCDDRNRLWLEAFDTGDNPLGMGRVWTVLPRDGKPSSVRFPAGFSPVVFTAAGVLGISRDSLGAESVGRVALPTLLVDQPQL